ncbi:hypothetical protein A4A49_65261, partial [Nicotiana attenuata]
NAAVVQEKRGAICISGESNHTQNELLSRSIVGSIPEGIIDIPTLSEIRHWTSNSWKQEHGVNIYEMGQNRFLFEFSSKITAEHVLKGEWF